MLGTCLRWGKAIARAAWWPLLWKGVAWAGAVAAVAHVGTASMGHIGPAAATALAHGDARMEAAASAGIAAASASARASPSASCCASAGVGAAYAADGRLRINAAAAADFEKLPGIGQKRAEAIVTLRERIGGFRQLRDLMRVRGIGFRTVQRLEPLIEIDDPSPPPK